MSKKIMLVMLGVLLVGGLWVMPIQSVTAQEEETTEEIASEESAEESGARGPGAVIIMVGLAAIFIVGFSYISRQGNNAPAN